MQISPPLASSIRISSKACAIADLHLTSDYYNCTGATVHRKNPWMYFYRVLGINSRLGTKKWQNGGASSANAHLENIERPGIPAPQWDKTRQTQRWRNLVHLLFQVFFSVVQYEQVHLRLICNPEQTFDHCCFTRHARCTCDVFNSSTTEPGGRCVVMGGATKCSTNSPRWYPITGALHVQSSCDSFFYFLPPPIIHSVGSHKAAVADQF